MKEMSYQRHVVNIHVVQNRKKIMLINLLIGVGGNKIHQSKDGKLLLI